MKLQEIKISEKALFLTLQAHEEQIGYLDVEDGLSEAVNELSGILTQDLIKIPGMFFTVDFLTSESGGDVEKFMFFITLNGTALNRTDKSFHQFTWLTIANGDHDHQTLAPKAKDMAGVLELARTMIYTWNTMIAEFNRFHGSN